MNDEDKILAPKLTNNPSWDVVVTEREPMLNFFNVSGGPKKRSYEIEIDTAKDFNSPAKIVYQKVEETAEFITSKKIEAKDALLDKTQYYWRARTVTARGKSDWVVSRFFVDTESDKHFMDLVRAPIKNVEVSGGYNAKNIIDYDDPGLLTFWQSPPPCDDLPWVKFDFGQKTTISRIWILSNPGDPDGWLKDFVLEKSNNGENWQKIKEIKDNDTFRNIIDFDPVEARYIRLKIDEFIGYACQINEMIFYSPGKPETPVAPKEKYVLIIGNEHNGFTFTDLAKHVEGLELNLKTLVVPYFEASLSMLEKLDPQPVAVILSGNNADYPNLPMFEHNGEFEIIRNSSLPILGICAGHQFLAMAYGYTRASSMGWSDITAIEPKKKWTKTKILKKDPIFENIKDDFVAPEIHGWAVVEPSDEFEIIAKSTYIQAQKSKRRLIYGCQFHPEIHVSYNHGQPYIKNFLKMALELKK